MVQKVVGRSYVRGWAVPSDNWKTFTVNPAVKVYLFQIGKDKAAKGEEWALPFISCAQDAVGL